MLPHEFLASGLEQVKAGFRQFLRVSDIFCREWLLGPHGPKENRGVLGRFGLFLIESRLWERLFLAYILFNSILKLTWRRDLLCTYEEFLNTMALWACLIFTFELIVGILVYGAIDFFSQKWYLSDTVATLFNWASYSVSMGYLPGFLSFLFPNISFIRMLRFLKPLGRIKALIASKIVVKTVADAIGSMIPVLSLVFFFTLLFAIIGINLFGRRGLLRYRCGIPLPLEEADIMLTEDAQNVLNFKNCTVNMENYMIFLSNQDRGPDGLRDLTINGTEMTCIATTPSVYCKCEKGSDDNIPFVCVDLYGMCSSTLCFRGDKYVGASALFTFENFLSASMSVIAFLYLKDWTGFFIASSACAGSGFGYVYYFVLVIFGSFCLLNLTVATVSEAYSKVKKLTSAKQKRLDEERLEKERLEADREEMQRQARRASRGDGPAEEPLLFDTGQAYRYWAIGPLVLFPCLHRCYFKDWNSGGWFALRALTFNYALLGWVLDGATMGSINEAASRAEQERIESRRADLEAEQQRIRDTLETEGKTRALILALSYPMEETPAHWSIRYLQSQIDALEIQNAAPEEEGAEGAEESSIASMDSESELPLQTQSSEPRWKWTQSLFAWSSDFIVTVNAASMAMQGFGPNLSPIITAVGYFATVYFVVESVLKSVAYCGFHYYIADSQNQLDFFLVIVPTFGELVCQLTKALPVTNYREDYIYPMLVLRALRVLRILKLTKHMKDLKILAQRAFGSPSGVIYAFLVTISFIFLIALFGNQLFRSSTTFADARNDFQFIMEAMKALIETLFGDRYYESIDAGFEASSFVGVLFFIIYYYIGNFVVLRIFIAIILENFEYAEEKKICLQIQLYQRHQILSNDLIDGTARPISFQETLDRLRKQNLDEEGLDRDTERWKKILEHRALEKGTASGPGKSKKLWDVVIDAFNSEYHPLPKKERKVNAFVQFITRIQMAARRVIYQVVENEQFSLLVADPLIDIPTNIRQSIDYSLLSFFATEVGAKMFAYGLWVPSGVSPRTIQFPEGKPAFFSSTEEGGWNALDAVFILIMFLDMPFIPLSTGNFKVIRIVRIVRPLARNSSKVKTLLASLFASIKSILNVINLFALLVLIYGLLGVQLFRGRFHFCNDGSAGGFSNCVGNVYGGFSNISCPVSNNQKCVSELSNKNLSNPFMGNETNQSLLVDRDLVETNTSIDLMSINNNQSNNDLKCHQDLGFFLGQSVLVPRVWDVPPENFENFGAACITLLRLFATDNMRSIYHSLMDIPATTDNICSDGSSAATGCPSGTTIYTISSGPQQNNMPQNILFGMTFIFIANAFISQLVIGVLIDNIRRQSGSALYTETQRVWIATAKTLSRLTLKQNVRTPDFWPRKKVYELVGSKNYETVIMIVVILNTAWMATEHDPRAPAYIPFVQPVEMTFLGIYILDLLLKMFSIGVLEFESMNSQWSLAEILKWAKSIWSPFFCDGWNAFDFFIVLMSLIDLSLPNIDLSFFKLLRVLRVFKLVNKVKTLKIMITTLLGAVKSILAALLFLGIWLFIFAAIGNDKLIFKNVRYGYGEMLSPTWNFRNIVNSMLLLFKVATGDSWFNLMYDASISYPFCTKLSLPVADEWFLSPFCFNRGNPPELAPGCLLVNDYFTDTYIISDCGLSAGAYLFLAVYYFGCVFIFLPLFIATLIDYFTNPNVQVETLSIFNGDDCELFAEVWNEFDPKLSGEISIDNLRPFIDRLYAKQHRVGFKVSSDLPRFKKIWARILTDPAYFPLDGVPVDEKNRKPDKIGLDVIDRCSIVKAFGMSRRSALIFGHLETNCAKFKEKRGREVRFEYAARVLCVFQEGNVQPLTTSDLVNLGSAVQMFMGLIGSNEVKGNEGKENEKWKALAVHNQLQEDLRTIQIKNAEAASNRVQASYDDLPKILQAKSILLSDLYPKCVPGHEWKMKPTPTGAKRNELLKKIQEMDCEYEKLMQSFIQEVLWGAQDDVSVGNEENEEHRSCLIDELLDGIIQVAVTKYSRNVSQKLTHMLSVSATSHVRQKRYTQALTAGGGPMEPAVSTVPRGWLNSGHAGAARGRMKPSSHLDDITDRTLASLRQVSGGNFAGRFTALRSSPTPPPRHASLMQAPSSALRSALRSATKEDAWRQCQIGTGPTVDAIASFVGWEVHSREQKIGSKMEYEDTLKRIQESSPQIGNAASSKVRSAQNTDSNISNPSGQTQTLGIGSIFAICSGADRRATIQFSNQATVYSFGSEG